MASKNNIQEVFVSLFSLACIIMIWIIALTVWVISPYFSFMNYRGNISLDLLRIVFMIFSIFLISLFTSIYYKKRIPIIHYFLDVIIKFNYPMIFMLGRVLKIPPRIIKASFIKVNNSIIENEKKKFKIEDIRVLISPKFSSVNFENKLENNEDKNLLCNSPDLDELMGICEENNLELASLSHYNHSLEQSNKDISINKDLQHKLFLVLADLNEITEFIQVLSDSNRIYGISDFGDVESERELSIRLKDALTMLA